MTPHIRIGESRHDLDILARRPALRLSIDGRAVTVEDRLAEGCLVLDGRTVPCVAVREGETVHLHLPGRTLSTEVLDPIAEAEGETGEDGAVLAPMPGTVISVACKQGDRVSAGDVLLTIESMKLEMSLAAPRDGVVAELGVAVGATFDKGQALVVFAPQDED